MRTIAFGLCCILPALFGQLYAGDFIGAVSLKYNAFIVLEGGHFEMTCEATHEDRRPDLQLYFINYSQKRTNVTGFETSGTGYTAKHTYSRSGARSSDSGDYFCCAKVGEDADQKKTSAGIPIQVIRSFL